MRIVFLFSSIIVLAACGTYNSRPDFMPSGYAYHQNTYKSEPGREIFRSNKIVQGEEPQESMDTSKEHSDGYKLDD